MHASIFNLHHKSRKAKKRPHWSFIPEINLLMYKSMVIEKCSKITKSSMYDPRDQIRNIAFVIRIKWKIWRYL